MRSAKPCSGAGRKAGDRLGALTAIVDAAEGGMAYDQMLDFDNAEGDALLTAGIDGLIDQTRSIERVVTALGYGAIEVEGSDSLDAPSTIFQ